MNQGIYFSAAGGIVQQVRMGTLANNLANADTVGFKADRLTVRQRAAEAIEDGPRRFSNALLDKIGGGVFVEDTDIRMDEGAHRHTGRALDVAIHGEGFFTVQGAEGTFYTRAGDFQVNSQGRLVTQDGQYDVLSDVGAPITLSPDAAVQIRSDGIIEQHGLPVARIGVSRFDETDSASLRKHGENVFVYTGNRGPAPVPPQVSAGALEKSNVNPITEMVQLIETSRQFEFNMRMIQYHDQLMETNAAVGRIA